MKPSDHAPTQRDNANSVPGPNTVRPPLNDETENESAAQERGERIETSKAISRGGKDKGHVPGAGSKKE
jgi:hypothetical protein